MKDSPDTTEVFKALGDPTRLEVIRLLSSDEQEDLSVSDLARKLGISQPAVSQHIKVLKNIGILEAHKRGFRVFYNVHKKRLASHKAHIDKLFKKLHGK